MPAQFILILLPTKLILEAPQSWAKFELRNEIKSQNLSEQGHNLVDDEVQRAKYLKRTSLDSF